MPFEKDKDLSIQFLKCLSRIKGWNYHDKIETEKKEELKEFISVYVFKNIPGGTVHEKISYNRLSFLINHPSFKPVFKAILALLDLSDNEKDFKEHYQKVTIKSEDN